MVLHATAALCQIWQ